MNTCEQKRIVIVDGYSTGRDLVRELLDRDVECLHLRSTAQVPASVAKSFDPAPYDADLGYLGGVVPAAAVLATLAPDEVIAGSEFGVTFAERLAHRMKLPTNRIETLAARRDKFAMMEAVRGHGLLAPEQASVTTGAAARAWAARHAAWPIVMKPMASAGSDGVTICHDHADIDAAMEKILGRGNFIGGINDRVLMQSFLPGPQFIVNSVSRGGRHYVSDIWSMEVAVSGSSVVPGGIALLDPGEPQAAALMEYTLDALDALGIENGAGHSELKWTPRGPALIETGARIMGAAMDRASYEAGGTESHAMVFARSLLAGAAECCALFNRRHYALARHMTKLLFNFRQPAEVVSTEGLARLRALPSFQAHYRGLAPGARVWKTQDWLCCGGVVYLIHDERRQIEADIATFREWESEGLLYGLAPLGALVEA